MGQPLQPNVQYVVHTPLPQPGARDALMFNGHNASSFLRRFKDMGDDYGLRDNKEILRRLPNYCEEWWRAHKTESPCMAAAARDFLAIPGTEVSVERVFSEARGVLQDNRHSFKGNTIRALMLSRDMYNCRDRLLLWFCQIVIVPQTRLAMTRARKRRRLSCPARASDS